jgi:hypothetical protein
MILHALASACIAFYLINVVRWQFKLRTGNDCIGFRYPMNRKPFNCMTCLSAWLGLGLGLLNSYGWHSLEILFIAGVMGIVVDGLIKKYL